MRNKGFQSNVINFNKRRYEKKYKALFGLLTKIKILFDNKFKRSNISKNYRKTINH